MSRPQPGPAWSECPGLGPGRLGFGKHLLEDARVWEVCKQREDPKGPAMKPVLAAPPLSLPRDLLNQGSQESPPAALLCLSPALFADVRELGVHLLGLCLSFHGAGKGQPASPPLPQGTFLLYCWQPQDVSGVRKRPLRIWGVWIWKWPWGGEKAPTPC